MKERSQSYYKFTNKECNHNGFQYQEGLNTDTMSWNTDECSAGGLHIVPVEHWYEWSTYRDDLFYVWDALPVSPLVISYEDKAKCHQIALSNRRAISEMDELKQENHLVAVRQNGYVIKYITNPSKTLQLAAVKQNGNAIRYIINPPEALRLVAVQQCPSAVRHITHPSEAVMLAAVKVDGHVISHIRNPSEAVVMAACKRLRWQLRMQVQ